MKLFVGAVAIVVVLGGTFIASWMMGSQRTPSAGLATRAPAPPETVSTAPPIALATSVATPTPTPPRARATSTPTAALIQVRDPLDPTSRVWAADSLYALDLITADLSAISQGLYVNKHVVDLPPGSLGRLVDRNASRTASLVDLVSSNPDYSGRWYVPNYAVQSR